MSRVIKLLLGASALCIPSSPGLAQSFSGPHVEGVIGYSHDGGRGDGRGSATDGGSFVYGVGAGYDVRRRDFVIGVVGELTDTTAKDELRATIAQPGSQGALGRDYIEGSRAVFGGLRLGYVVAPRTLVYGLAGYTNSRTREKLSARVNGVDVRTDYRVDREGVRVGAGIEQAVTRRLFLRAEYRHTDDGPARNQLITAAGWRF